MENINVHVGAGKLAPNSEIPTKERTLDMSPDRKHVNVLLDISEEAFIKDLEPYEYHCYHGSEQSVCGWARVAPLAPILLAQKTGQKPKRKDAEHDSATSAEPDHVAEQPSESHLALHKSRSKLWNQHILSCTNPPIPNPTPDIPEALFGNDLSKAMGQMVLKDLTEEISTPFQHHQMSSEYDMVVDNRSSKSPKNSQRSSNEFVSVKNLTFLPPINMPHTKQNCTCKKHPQGGTMMENLYIIDKFNRIQGTKGDLVYTSELPKDAYNEAVSSKYRTCRHSSQLYSTVSVTVPKRYHVAVSSKPETLHATRYSMSKTLCTGTAANRQVHMHPSCLYS